MRKPLYTDNADTAINAAIDAAAIGVVVLDGAKFAAPGANEFQRCTLTDGVNFEIVYLTARSGAAFTIERGKEGTTARAWPALTRIFAGATADPAGRWMENRAAAAHQNSAVCLGAAANDPSGVLSAFQASTAYAPGDAIYQDSRVCYVTIGGVSGGSAPSFASDFSTVVSGGVTFRTAQAYSEASGTQVGANSLGSAGGMAVGSGAMAPRGGVALQGGWSYAGGVAVMGKAFGLRSTAINSGARAYGDYSTAIGRGDGGNVIVAVDHAWHIHGWPVLGRDDWSVGANPYAYNSSAEAVGASWTVDLGSPPAWAASTVYTDADVVTPTTPNGKQYLLWCGTTEQNVATVTSDTSEPTWPTGFAASVGADADFLSYWICVDLAAGFDLSFPSGCRFFPSEIGFICQQYSGVTAAPSVSIGDAGNPTKFVNNQPLSGITAAHMRHAFTGLPGHGVTELHIRLDTAATGAGARFLGRFYFKGLFLEDKGRPQVNVGSW